MQRNARKRNKQVLFTTIVGFLFFSLSAEGAFRRLPGLQLSGVANVQRLLQATDHIVQADSMRMRGQRYLAQAQLRIASYRVRLVQAVLFGHRTRAAKQALGVAVDKLTDRHLPLAAKISIAADCVGVAISELASKTIARPVVAAKLVMQFVKKITPCNFFLTIESSLQATKTILLRAPLFRVGQALAAVEIAIDKVSDPYLSPRQKQYFVLDCLNVAMRSL